MTDNHNTPYINWSSPDLPGTFKLFKQKCEIFFTVRDIKPEKRFSHMLLYVGDEGLRMLTHGHYLIVTEKNQMCDGPSLKNT